MTGTHYCSSRVRSVGHPPSPSFACVYQEYWKALGRECGDGRRAIPHLLMMRDHEFDFFYDGEEA